MGKKKVPETAVNVQDLIDMLEAIPDKRSRVRVATLVAEGEVTYTSVEPLFVQESGDLVVEIYARAKCDQDDEDF